MFQKSQVCAPGPSSKKKSAPSFSRKRLKVLVALKGFAGLFFADDFYHLSLLSSEGDFITYDFIFNRVSQRGVEDYCHSLPLNESHLNESFSEATMSVDSDNYSFFSSF